MEIWHYEHQEGDEVAFAPHEGQLILNLHPKITPTLETNEYEAICHSFQTSCKGKTDEAALHLLADEMEELICRLQRRGTLRNKLNAEGWRLTSHRSTDARSLLPTWKRDGTLQVFVELPQLAN